MSPHILIIEDDDLVRKLYQDVFTLEKFRVATAVDGHQGVKLAKQLLPEAIVLDIMMPKMNGIDVLKKLKKASKTKAIPVIILSNLDDDAVIKEALGLGAAHYLLKSAHDHKTITSIVHKAAKQKPASA